MGVGALMAFPLGFFFPLLRHCNTKYIASFYFLSLSLYLVLIARSIYQSCYVLDLSIYLMVMVCYIYLCVRVARSIPKLLCFGFNYLSNRKGGLYLFMFKDILV